MIQEVLAEAYAGFWGEAVLPEEGDWVEASCPIEREGRGLPDAGFEDKSPDAKGPRLRLERSHEAPPEPAPAHDGRHIHPLEFGRLGIEEPQGAAADRRSPSVNDEESAAPVGYFLGIQVKVVRSRLGIDAAELGVQRVDEGTADLGGQLNARYRDRF